MKYSTLQDYPRPANDSRWGFHWNASAWPDPQYVAWILPFLKASKTRWVKLVASNDAAIKTAELLIAQGIEVIIRLYQYQPHPWYVPSVDTVKQYVSIGVRYIEWGNEPNLVGPGGEWSEAFNLDKLMNQHRRASENIKAAGGIPLFPAMSPGGNVYGGHAEVYDRCFEWLAKDGDTLEDSGVAIHPRPLNHPLIYPYDSINQKEHPGATTTQDSTCLLMCELVDKKVKQLTGGVARPLLGTEFGAACGDNQDNRYPMIDRPLFTKRNVDGMVLAYKTGYAFDDPEIDADWWHGASFDSIKPKGRLFPDSVFCGCHWLLAAMGHGAFANDFWIDNPLWGNEKLELPGVVYDRTLAADRRLVDIMQQQPYERAWVEGTTPVIVPPPPIDPTYPPEWAFQLGFKDFVAANKLPLVPRGALIYHGNSGDPIQPTYNTQTQKRGFLLGFKGNGTFEYVEEV